MLYIFKIFIAYLIWMLSSNINSILIRFWIGASIISIFYCILGLDLQQYWCQYQHYFFFFFLNLDPIILNLSSMKCCQMPPNMEVISQIYMYKVGNRLSKHYWTAVGQQRISHNVYVFLNCLMFAIKAVPQRKCVFSLIYVTFYTSRVYR